MENIISEEALKSYIKAIISQNYKDSSAPCREDILTRLWEWILKYCPYINENELEAMKERLREHYDKVDIVDIGKVNGIPTRILSLPNSSWHLRQSGPAFYIAPSKVMLRMYRCREWDANLAIHYISAFDKIMPQVIEHIDAVISETARGRMLCEISAATGLAILEQVKEEECLSIPEVASIRGTEKGRVAIYFASGEKINCPLDYLRNRLIRRFKKSERK